MVEEVKRYRSEMGTMIQDLKDKQDRMQILNEEKSKLNKNINRSARPHRHLFTLFLFLALSFVFYLQGDVYPPYYGYHKPTREAKQGY
jgi:hypothetical protein